MTFCYESYKIEDRKFLKDGVFDYTKLNFSELKEQNDWDKEINEEKCTKKPLVTRNNGKLNVSEKTFEKIISNYAKNTGYKGEDTIYRYNRYNTSDAYGRELYYVWGIGRDVYGEGVSPTSTAQYYEFAIIINPNETISTTLSYLEETDIVSFVVVNKIFYGVPGCGKSHEIKTKKTRNRSHRKYCPPACRKAARGPPR